MKLLPQIQQYNFLSFIVGFFEVASNVFILECIEFLVTVSYANCVMDAELELVSTALACASPYNL